MWISTPVTKICGAADSGYWEGAMNFLRLHGQHVFRCSQPKGIVYLLICMGCILYSCRIAGPVATNSSSGMHSFLNCGTWPPFLGMSLAAFCVLFQTPQHKVELTACCGWGESKSLSHPPLFVLICSANVFLFPGATTHNETD